MILEVLLLVVTALAAVYLRFRYRSNHWTRLGVRQPKVNHFPLGNNPILHPEVLFSKTSNIGDIVVRQYQEFKDEKYYGTYAFPSCCPVLVLKDPELIKEVQVKAFDHFVDRNSVIYLFGTNEPQNTVDLAWKKQMGNAKGDEWKDIRSRFSPIFTSGKLKIMTEFVNLVSQDMVKQVELTAKDQKPVELKDVFGKFSMDTIASCAFGVNAGSFNDKETTFVKHAKNIFTRNTREGIMFMATNIPLIKNLIHALGIPIFKPKETEFFIDIVTKTLKHRIGAKSRRNDLVDLMIEAMSHDLSSELKTNDHASEQFEKDQAFNHNFSRKEIDDITMVATAMAMLVAGYDTTAQTMSFIGYEITKNQGIQDNLQAEIDEAFENTNAGENLSYSTVMSMEYLDMVIHEALRLYSPANILTRACIKDYTLPGTDLTIKRGDEVHISSLGIHRDPEFYPDPLTFDPERFSKKAKASRHPYAFQAFGQGPRSCIGMRFALLEAKVGLIHLLRRFSLVPCKQTPSKLTRDPESVLGNVKEPLLVKAVSRVL